MDDLGWHPCLGEREYRNQRMRSSSWNISMCMHQHPHMNAPWGFVVEGAADQSPREIHTQRSGHQRTRSYLTWDRKDCRGPAISYSSLPAELHAAIRRRASASRASMVRWKETEHGCKRKVIAYSRDRGMTFFTDTTTRKQERNNKIPSLNRVLSK